MAKNVWSPFLGGVKAMAFALCLGIWQPDMCLVAAAAESGEEKIVINVASRSLALYRGQEKVRLYPVALGSASTPTPTGYYKILYKEVNPTWTDPSDPTTVIPSGPSNPLGYRWMQFIGNYGIHGTNRPDSIGRYVSNGCIRMFEKDAEALYDLVEVGTPVEITYNRIVVEKIPDGTVVYYIYPDGYRRQALDIKSVRTWLAAYGVDAFESDEAIAEKISQSDGQPTYIGKPYSMVVNEQPLNGKAVKLDGVMFVPVKELAGALGLDLQWLPQAGIVKTAYGDAVGWEKNQQLYANADDVSTLFRLDGSINKAGQYVLKDMPSSKPMKPKTEPEKTQAQIPVKVPENETAAKPAVPQAPPVDAAARAAAEAAATAAPDDAPKPPALPPTKPVRDTKDTVKQSRPTENRVIEKPTRPASPSAGRGQTITVQLREIDSAK